MSYMVTFLKPLSTNTFLAVSRMNFLFCTDLSPILSPSPPLLQPVRRTAY